VPQRPTGCLTVSAPGPWEWTNEIRLRSPDDERQPVSGLEKTNYGGSSRYRVVQDDLGEPARACGTIYKLMGSVQFPDMLLEVGAATGYSESLLGQPTQVTVTMRALEGSGRLRRANERVAQFQSRIPIATLWGDGD